MFSREQTLTNHVEACSLDTESASNIVDILIDHALFTEELRILVEQVSTEASEHNDFKPLCQSGW